MKSHDELVREAAAEDGARALLKAAAEVERVAGNFCDISETQIRRAADRLRMVANLKRVKISQRMTAHPVSTPFDVRDVR